MMSTENGNGGAVNNVPSDNGDEENEKEEDKAVVKNKAPSLRVMTWAEIKGPVHHKFLDDVAPPKKDCTNRAIYALFHACKSKVNLKQLKVLGFTNETFGVILDRQIRQWVLHLKPKSTDYVLDMGCGYGNIVLFVAALAPQVQNVVGIEISDKCKEVMFDFMTEFKRIFLGDGFKMAKTELHYGNFLNGEYDEHYFKSNIIFLNNDVFKDDLMQEIINKFYECVSHGTKIISSKPLGDIDRGRQIKKGGGRQFTERQFKDVENRRVPEALFDIEKIIIVKGQNTNWKKTNHQFYINIVNRNKLEAFKKFFETRHEEEMGRRTRPVKGERRVSEEELRVMIEKIKRERTSK